MRRKPLVLALCAAACVSVAIIAARSGQEAAPAAEEAGPAIEEAAPVVQEASPAIRAGELQLEGFRHVGGPAEVEIDVTDGRFLVAAIEVAEQPAEIAPLLVGVSQDPSLDRGMTDSLGVVRLRLANEGYASRPSFSSLTRMTVA